MRHGFMREKRTERRRCHRPLNAGAAAVATTALAADARCAVVIDGAVVTDRAAHHHARWSLCLISTPALRRD